MRWLGHPIESPKLPYTGHHWTRRGKGKGGRLRTTLRRKITSELEEMGFTMGQAQYVAKGRGRCRQIVDFLCPIRDEKDK